MNSISGINTSTQTCGLNFKSNDEAVKRRQTSTPTEKSDSFNSSKSLEEASENYFDKCSAKKLPAGMAIKISTRTTWPWKIANTFGLLVSLGGVLPIWVFKTNNDTVLKLVKIDENNLTKKQKKLIRDGKLINYIPQGYELKNGKILKMEE